MTVGPTLQPGEKRFRIAMIFYDDMTNQDFVGPNDVFSRVPTVAIDVLAKTADAVRTDSRGRVLPDTAIKDAWAHYDLLFIGGGAGSTRLMEDPKVLEFLRSRAPNATWITSVCMGALVLGAAGLLDGYKAATHWAAMDVLRPLGAIPTHQRVVFDRNRITGGGVTAGIDSGLALVGMIWGDEFNQLLQFVTEYDPQPFQPGSPEKASSAVVAQAGQMVGGLTQARFEAARRSMAARRAEMLTERQGKPIAVRSADHGAARWPENRVEPVRISCRGSLRRLLESAYNDGSRRADRCVGGWQWARAASAPWASGDVLRLVESRATARGALYRGPRRSARLRRFQAGRRLLETRNGRRVGRPA